MKKSGNPITHIGALEVEALGSDASPDGERLLPRFVADAGTLALMEPQAPGLVNHFIPVEAPH
jgi:hypothetical protein